MKTAARRAALALAMVAALSVGLFAATAPSFRSGTEIWVAASAHADGSNGTKWVTDVWIQAPSGAVEVDVNFLASGLAAGQSAANVAAPPVRVSVPAGGQLFLPDILASKFSVESGSGALRFASVGENPKPILVTTRTYNNAATGTFGQFIPGVPAATAFGLSDGSAATAQQAIGLMTEPYRTNVGVVNVSKGSPASVTIEVRSRSGEFLGSVSETFEPWTMKQYDRIFTVIGATPANDARAVIRVTGGAGKVLAYASVIDNRTGDPVYVPGTNGQ